MIHRKYKDKSHLLFPIFAFFLLIGATFFAIDQSDQRQNIRSRASEETTPSESEQATEPVNQILSLDFMLSGIGSQSGNINPLHKQRSVNVYFYDSDKNSNDKSVKPLFSLISDVEYNSSTNSFVNPNINITSKIPDGDYQIVLKTNQSVSHLIKSKDSDIGGVVFSINKLIREELIITNQVLILGDIHPDPDGDNTISADDFNALVSCFGTKAGTSSCKAKDRADLNDDGVIDGTDYNIMSSSYKFLSAQGLIIPTPANSVASSSPKPSTKPAPSKNTKPESNTGLIVIAIFALVVISFVAGRIYVLKKRKYAIDLEKSKVFDGEYYIKSHAYDDINKREVLTLSTDNGPILGYYKGEKVADGFAKIKGVLKKENNKEFIEISSIDSGKKSS